ncbi:hypothetical protein B4119_3091 [Parageobacillus caldoxylosilyticus]|uniref:Uncharacterized protein n=1 Tax=Saccharococcus caldoxylosilyticus TaxID=81408 RepID=A0A150LTC1_9BACL|nr:hypothetical protein B4119_3091 [Parageobacillus caldoxylosilyticus]
MLKVRKKRGTNDVHPFFFILFFAEIGKNKTNGCDEFP